MTDISELVECKSTDTDVLKVSAPLLIGVGTMGAPFTKEGQPPGGVKSHQQAHLQLIYDMFPFGHHSTPGLGGGLLWSAAQTPDTSGSHAGDTVGAAVRQARPALDG